MGDLDARWSALVESGRARWCPGMLVRSGITMRLDWRDPDGRWNGAYTHGDGPRGGWLRVIEASMLGEWSPDWSDPATLGCLLGLVREAWGDPGATTRRMVHPVRWWVVCYDSARGQGVATADAPTEAGALLAALESAPHHRAGGDPMTVAPLEAAPEDVCAALDLTPPATPPQEKP